MSRTFVVHWRGCGLRWNQKKNVESMTRKVVSPMRRKLRLERQGRRGGLACRGGTSILGIFWSAEHTEKIFLPANKNQKICQYSAGICIKCTFANLLMILWDALRASFAFTAEKVAQHLNNIPNCAIFQVCEPGEVSRKVGLWHLGCSGNLFYAAPPPEHLHSCCSDSEADRLLLDKDLPSSCHTSP